MECDTQLLENLINISNVPHHMGMYYEFQEHVKLINIDWSLITYLDLSYSKFQSLMLSCKTTVQVYTDLQNKVRVAEFSYPCKQFDQSVHTHLFKANLDNIWSSLRQDFNKEKRVRHNVGTFCRSISKNKLNIFIIIS